jgi:nicotinic acid phosphoribosyltransferase
MPALVAVRYNPQIKAAYGRICQKRPKEKKIGVTAAMRRLLLLIYTLWKNGEEYDPMRDKTHTPKKRMKEEDTELEYGPEDCIGPKHEPADWNATDEHGNPPF